MRVELHCHSTCSDGSESPEEVARRARERGVELFCLTDHDTTAGWEATRDVLGDAAMRGLELSCRWRGGPVHVLLYDVAGDDERWQAVEERLVGVHETRRARVYAIAERLAKLGVTIDPDAVLERARGRTVGRPDIARAMVEVGAVDSIGEAFERFLHDGGPGDVALERLSVADGLAIGRAAGAVMSLAHPHQHGRDRAREIVRDHRARGLDGLEVYYGTYDARERRRWRRLAEDHDMVATGGSDFHGDVLPQIREVGVEVPEPAAAALRAWLGR